MLNPSAVAEGILLLSVPTVNQGVVTGHQNATALRETVPACVSHAWDRGRQISARLAEHVSARCAGEGGAGGLRKMSQGDT